MQEFADAYQARGPEVARGCDSPGIMQAAPTPVVPATEPVTIDVEARSDR